MASKNQRSGPVKKYVPKKCRAGHDIIRAKRVPVFGRARMVWVCVAELGVVVECTA